MWIAIANGIGTRQGVGGGVGPTPPPPYTPPLDVYPATAAYSVRKLSSSYSGSCMRVRRFVPPYDEQDIGFTAAGHLDEAAIVAFGGSDELRVSAWYDQSGNSNHATQITPDSQPQIYDGAAVITENGKPALSKNSGGSGVLSTSAISGATTISIFDVAVLGSTGNRVAQLGNVIHAGGFMYQGSILSFTSTNASQVLTSLLFKTTDEAYLNGSQVASGNAGTASAGSGVIGGQSASLRVIDSMQEFVFYTSDQTDYRTGIETNINRYFDIYTLYNPDPATSGFLFDYPDAAAAYSVRQLNNNATTALRVRRTVAPFDEQDIGFDGNGDLDTTAISTFGGSDSLTVSRWYDQTGNQNHAEQDGQGSQPQIYNGTAVITENGKPTLSYDTGSNTYLLSSSNVRGASDDFSAFTVGQTQTNYSYFWSLGNSSSNREGFARRDNANLYYVLGSSAPLATSPDLSVQRLHTYTRSGLSSDSVDIRIDSSQVTITGANSTTQSLSASQIYLGSYIDTTLNCTGSMQECIFYASDQSSPTDNRTDIEDNINEEYLIYQPTDAPTSGLLATYTGAAAAYSVRQLANTAVISMRVRRDSDDEERNIGFDSNGDLATADISEFCGTANGYVTRWYDQSTNGNHATQITAESQPQIYNGTAVITENGKPAVYQNGITTFRNTTLNSSVNQNNMALFAAGRWAAASPAYAAICDLLTLSQYEGMCLAYLGDKYIYNNTQFGSHVSNDFTQRLWSGYADNASSDVKFYRDGVQQASTTPSSQAHEIFAIGHVGHTIPSTKWNGYMNEIILFGTSTKADHSAIETNINDHFDIYT